MKKRNILAGTAAVLVLVFLVVVIAVNHRLQRQNEYLQDLKTQTTDLSSSTDQKEEENQGAEKEREQELDREIAFWSGSEVHSLGLMDLQALSFWAEQNASHPVSGIISCHDFSRQDRNFRLLVYMVCRDGENKLSFRLYQQRQHGYALLKSQESELSLFDSFWDMECRVKVFLRERGDDLEIVCSQQKFRMEGNTKMYQIFRLSENGFEEIFRLVSARETVSARVEKNGEMIYLSSDDGQQTEGVYSDPEEAVSQELEQAGLSEQDFEKPEQAQENDICFLTSARTGDSWTTGEFSGEVQDYTDVRIRLEELGIYWEEESASKEETGSMRQLVADEEVEAQTLHVREVFNEQVACTAAGTYEQADLGNGFTAWLDCGKIMVIKTRVEDVTDAYEEIYNFEDGKLIFAFEKRDGKESRFYYKDDSLFRWCYPDYETRHDNEYENPEFISQGTAYQARGYDLYYQAADMLSQ